MITPKKYRTITVASILIVASLVILTVSLHRPAEIGFFRKLVLEISSPAVDGINSSIDGIRSVWKRYVFLVGLKEENRMLKMRVAELTKESNAFRELYLEERRLKELFGLKENLQLPAIAARVIGRENTRIFKTILINRGTMDGLRIGLPVIASEGVVGRIVEASWNVSRVLLVVDYNSNVDAVLQGSRLQGILQGGSSTGCTLKYLERSEEVKIGEKVITSGLGGIFPKGLILGTILSVDRKGSGLFQKVEVLPAVHFSQLEEVLVLIPGGESKP
jgi:rod shape-determining protein MreC